MSEGLRYFQRVPETVAAVQFTGANLQEIREFVAPFALVIPTVLPSHDRGLVPGLHLQFIARTYGLRHGHWLLKRQTFEPTDPAGIADNFTTCTPEQMDADYRPLENQL